MHCNTGIARLEPGKSDGEDGEIEAEHGERISAILIDCLDAVGERAGR
jgi:hypothetical protein